MPLGESFGRKVPLLVLNSADAALGYGFGLAGMFVGGVVANLLCACLAYLWFNSTLRRLSLESP